MEKVRKKFWKQRIVDSWFINHFIDFKLENIKVRFFEQDDDQIIWEDWGKFTEADVHHQYAIALKTPPYRKPNIDESVSHPVKKSRFIIKITKKKKKIKFMIIIF